MVTLNPAPSELGLSSPALGPWFSDKDIEIPAPNQDLSVTLNLDGCSWLPPAAGLLSLYVAGDPRPPGLAGLRQASGEPAFQDGSLVALFRLLPAVEERLHSLMAQLPPADSDPEAEVDEDEGEEEGSPSGEVPARARVRYLALELPPAARDLEFLNATLDPPFPAGTSFTGELSDAEKAEHVGLKLDNSDLVNADRPMFDLKRPGRFYGEQEILLKSLPLEPVKLWAFDARGRAVDPGAVAAWWWFLADRYDNLWAEGLEDDQEDGQEDGDENGQGERRTALTEGRLTLHLVNAHEGPLSSTLRSRLSITNAESEDETEEAAEDEGETETDTVLWHGGEEGPVQLQFSAFSPENDAPDDAPVPRVAMLPNGVYADTLSLWPSGAVHEMLGRDFVRVAVVEMEEHLVGQKRTAGNEAGEQAQRRAEDQHRPSTRVNVARTAAPVLLSTTDEAAAAAVEVFSGSDPARLVTSVLERDWGAIDPLSLPEAAPPEQLPALKVSALYGGGTSQNGTVTDQKVLLELDFEDGSLAGAWVRVWTQGFDLQRGRRFRMDGGGGRVCSDGRAFIVAGLPDGGFETPPPPTLLGADVLVVTAHGERLFADQRFIRPAPVGGAALDASSASGELVICEAGESYPDLDSLEGKVPSGAILFARSENDDPPALIDRATLPHWAFTEAVLVRNLGEGDVIQLTEPAFTGAPEGDAEGILEGESGAWGTGAAVGRHLRQGLHRFVEAGAPLPTMQRLEIACASAGDGEARAVVAATPSLSRYHELLPHQLGHPGAPAAVEVHGTGAVLSGPAALCAAEFVRERTAGSTFRLAELALSPFPGQEEPASPGPWAAVLRTVAAGVEAEINPELLSSIFDSDNPYPFGDALESIRDWLEEHEEEHEIEIPDEIEEAADSVVRALDRRMLAAARGAREGAHSILAAFRRAEDFVYIETPALDDTALGEENDRLALWQALYDRMGDDSRPALRVLICVPIHHMPGTPPVLGRVRDALLIEAVEKLKKRGGERVALFSPSAGPGRTLRLASTTVIVDDAFALTGTTHLWRRGLSFDSSLAVAVFDEVLDNGRPAEVYRFRRQLLADRLGLPVELVPDDPAELVDAVCTLGERGGGGRLATDAVVPPDPVPSEIEKSIWNRDGSMHPGQNPLGWLAQPEVIDALQGILPQGG